MDFRKLYELELLEGLGFKTWCKAGAACSGFLSSLDVNEISPFHVLEISSVHNDTANLCSLAAVSDATYAIHCSATSSISL